MPLFAGSAFGWGCAGHQMIAFIARAHLTPTASAAVDRLLRDNPIDPALSRFCREHPADLMADSITWADDVKSTLKTGEWHYIDIPLAVTRGNAMEWCPPIGPSVEGGDRPGCLLNALAAEIAILRDKTQPDAIRAEALRYVIHLLGDLTQPLHTDDNRDQGGNCVALRTSYQERPTNLHSLWDSGLIAEEAKRKQFTDAQFAAWLDREFSDKWDAWSNSPVDLEAWAWESHGLDASVVYSGLQPPVPVEPRDAGRADKAACDEKTAQTGAMHITIGQPYIDAAMPVIHQQLVKASYRVAGMLNQIFQ
jgi:hypothetical protein